MRRHRIFGIASLLSLLVLTASVIVPGLSQEQKPQIKTRARKFDENRFPIADYNGADPSEAVPRL